MKKLLYCLFFVSSFSFAQDGFIEIEVRDSIHLKAINFDYIVKVNVASFYDYGVTEEYNPADNKQKLTDKTDELRYLVTKKGYKFKALEDENYEIYNSPYINNYGFTINLKSHEELSKLKEDLKVLDFVQGDIGNVVYEGEEEADGLLFKKLIAKAKAKAQLIAELSNLTLGKIIEIKEVPEVDNFSFNIMDIYRSSLGDSTTSFFKNDLVGEQHKAIVVKFVAD